MAADPGTDPMAVWLQAEITADRDYAKACLARPIPGTDFEAIHERIARCEAELAILDDHGLHAGPHGRRTVTLLASGYRHRPGYLREWAP